METWHIYPADEENKHNLTGQICICDPEVEYVQEGDCLLIKHNSFDGREALEEAKSILGL